MKVGRDNITAFYSKQVTQLASNARPTLRFNLVWVYSESQSTALLPPEGSNILEMKLSLHEMKLLLNWFQTQCCEQISVYSLRPDVCSLSDSPQSSPDGTVCKLQVQHRRRERGSGVRQINSEALFIIDQHRAGWLSNTWEEEPASDVTASQWSLCQPVWHLLL